jgi:hypothetical protein
VRQTNEPMPEGYRNISSSVIRVKFGVCWGTISASNYIWVNSLYRCTSRNYTGVFARRVLFQNKLFTRTVCLRRVRNLGRQKVGYTCKGCNTYICRWFLTFCLAASPHKKTDKAENKSCYIKIGVAPRKICLQSSRNTFSPLLFFFWTRWYQ